jgi:sugar phosphate isomerase/epimerase
MRLSIFTACTPWLPLDRLVPEVAAAGYDGIEVGLRERQWDPAKPPSFWGNNPAHLDWRTCETEALDLRRRLDAAGLRCPCVGAYLDTAAPADPLRVAAAVAGTLGATLVRLRTPVPMAGRVAEQWRDARARLRELERIAAAAGIAWAIEMHDRSLTASANACLRLLEDRDPRRIGVILEPGNMVTEGNEALPMAIELLAGRILHVHVKDMRIETRDRADRLSRAGTAFAPLGSGVLDWPGILAQLAAQGYDGWLSVENFTGCDAGPGRMAGDLATVRGWLGGADITAGR